MLTQHARRGSATLIATIFLVILVSLAAGIQSTVSTSVQVTRNEQAVHLAMAAAESGAQLMKNYLTGVVLDTPDEEAVFTQLLGAIDQMTPVNGSITVEAVQPNGEVTQILFPQQSNASLPRWIRLHPAEDLGCFRAIVRKYRDAGRIHAVVSVTGWDGHTTYPASNGQPEPITRTLHLDFRQYSAIPAGVFGYGVFSNGGIQIGNNCRIKGQTAADDPFATVGSASAAATTIALRNNTLITGEIAVAVREAQVTKSNNVTTGDIRVVPAPELPQFDPSVFRDLATTVYTAGMRNTVQNIRIPANTDPSLGNNLTIEGILYIESPNAVTIGNNVTVRGPIIFAKRAAGADTLTVSNNASILPLPEGSAFDTLRARTRGYAILAPTANVEINNNVETVGSIICNKFEVRNNAECHLQDGTLLTYSTASDACSIKNNCELTFSRRAVSTIPANGISSTPSRWFRYNPAGYSEVMP
jgi:hypothetical protein